MRNSFTSLFFLMAGFGLSAQTFQFDSVNFKQMEIGVMTIKNDTWVIHVDHGNFSEYFMPVNLPEKYKVTGQDVVFEGAIGKIPMNTRLAGTPIKLSMIRNLYKAKPRDEDSENEVSEDNNNQASQFDSVGYLQNASGKIILIGDTYVIEQTVNGELKRYVPDFLPEDFKHENTEITFSGVLGKIPPNARMMGAPLKIRELMFVENVAFDTTKIQESLKEFFPFDSAGYLQPVRGTVKKMGADPEIYIIETDNGNHSVMRYIPIMLPDEFKKEGAIVIISGTIGKIPPNVRLMGTPLTINEIKLAE